MAKKFAERKPVSARAVVPTLSEGPSAVMRIDDFPERGDEREHITSALASVVKPPVEEYEFDQRDQPVREIRRSAPVPVSVAVVAPISKKMISTPIDSELRKMLFELRSDYEISIAFTIETALRGYFADRAISSIAEDLKSRGGRLRRHQK